ncbi:MAG: hypothetical protein Q8Q36_01770, partial [bacterium]|nr:hypothetical protein [bacterium]
LVLSSAGTGATKCLQVSAIGLISAAAGECGTSGGYTTVQNEGTPLTQRSIINFVGSGVDCVDDGADSTDCTIDGGGSAAGNTGNVQFNSGGAFTGNDGLFYLTNPGRLGIGTTTPYGVLSVSTSTRPQLVLSDPTAAADLKHFYASSTQGRFAIGTLTDDLATLSEMLTLTSGGNFGVGTTTPYAKLAVHANDGETNTTLFAVASSTASSLTTHFVISNAGNVGIGATAPSAKLDISEAGSSDQLRLRQSDSVFSGLYLDSVGDLIVSATGENVRLNDENLWICSGGSCNATGKPGAADTGNVILETALFFDNNFKFAQTGATEVTMFASSTSSIVPVLIFDDLAE